MEICFDEDSPMFIYLFKRVHLIVEELPINLNTHALKHTFPSVFIKDSRVCEEIKAVTFARFPLFSSTHHSYIRLKSIILSAFSRVFMEKWRGMGNSSWHCSCASPTLMYYAVMVVLMRGDIRRECEGTKWNVKFLDVMRD